MQAASIPKKIVPTIGISMDYFCKNMALEGMQSNVQRLKIQYQVSFSRCIVYRCSYVFTPSLAALLFKAGDSTPEELATAIQVQDDYMPITHGGEKHLVKFVKVIDDMKAYKA